MVTLDASGDGTITFTGTQVASSVITCYTSDSASGPWLIVADGFSSTSSFCGAGDSGADLVVVMINGIPGWFFMATVAGAP